MMYNSTYFVSSILVILEFFMVPQPKNTLYLFTADIFTLNHTLYYIEQVFFPILKLKL